MQFFFTRTETIKPPEETVKDDGAPTEEASKEVVTKDFTDSFNIDMVLLSVDKGDGTREVTLNDGHTESRYERRPKIENGQFKGKYEIRKEAAYYQAIVTLNKEDAKRFVEYFNTQTINTN